MAGIIKSVLGRVFWFVGGLLSPLLLVLMPAYLILSSLSALNEAASSRADA